MADKGFKYYALLLLAVISLAVAVFDVITDWVAFGDFVVYDAGKLTIALGVACVISSILAFFEVRNSFFTFRLVNKTHGVNNPLSTTDTDVEGRVLIEDPEETRLQLWIEVVSFLVLVLEDLPVAVILYIAYIRGNCDLFREVFRDSNTAKLVLAGTIVSCVWKLVMAFVYCCRLCTCQFRHVKLYAVCCCCCCRVLRPTLAITLLAFACYFYTKAHIDTDSVRQDCVM